MSEILSVLECSVEADVSLAFAWAYRIDIATWDDPPATFSLEGPFAPGSRGTTALPGQPLIHWLVREVVPEQMFVIEMPLDRAALLFEWRFDPVSADSTRLTQRLILTGDNAAAHVTAVRDGFGATLRDGMRRLTSAMAADAARSGSR